MILFGLLYALFPGKRFFSAYPVQATTAKEKHRGEK
jgi:hypothetical protein